MADKKKKAREEFLKMHNSTGESSPGTQNKSTASKAATTSKQKERQEKFLQLHNQYNPVITRSGKKEDEKVISFFTDVQNYFREASNPVSRSSYSAVLGDGKQEVKASVASNWKKRSDWVRSYLDDNRHDIGETRYKDLSQLLAQVNLGLKQISDANDSAKKYFSQFESEEDYNKHLDYSTKEGRKQRYANNQKKLDDLKAERQKVLLSDADRYTPVGYTDTGLPIFQPFRKNAAVEEIDRQIASVEAEMRNYERGNTDESGFYYGSKKVDDYSDIKDSAPYEIYSARRSYNIPTRADLQQLDIMSDPAQWRTDADNKIYDAFGTYIDPSNTDDSGNIIHPAAKEGRYALEDRLGLFLNTSFEEKQEALGTTIDFEGTWETVVKDGIDGGWDKLTQDEIGIYYTIMGTQGKSAADQYLSDMKVELNRRQTTEETQRQIEAFDEANALEKIAMSAASVPAQMLGGIASSIENAAYTLQGKDINPYSAAQSFSHFSNTIRSQQAAELDETGIAIPGIDFTLGDAYQSVMSVADSLAARKLVGTFGSNLSNEAISSISGAVLATSAASSEASRLYEQGASKEQVILGSASAGAAEMVFESLSIEKLLEAKAAGSLKQVVLNVLTQGGVEASEEALTEIANIVTNSIIMGTQSDWQKTVDANGGDVKKALLEKTLDVIHSGVGGFISGAGSSTIHSSADYAIQRGITKSIGEEIAQADGGVDALKALAMDVAGANTKITKQANKVTGEVVTGKGLGKIKAYAKNSAEARRVGKLYQSVQQSVSKSNVSDIASVLEEKGYDAKSAKNIAEAVVAKMDGKELDAFQKGTLKAYAGDAKIDQAVEQLMNDTESAVFKRNKALNTFVDSMTASAETLPDEKSKATQRINTSKAKRHLEAHYEVSKNGRSILKESGAPVTISGIASVEKGKIELNTDNGAVSANDVSFASKDEALIYEAVAKIGNIVDAEAANKLVKQYDPAHGVSAMVYGNGMAQAYMYGYYGYTMAETQKESTLSSMLTDTQRKAAYILGKKYRDKTTTKKQDVDKEKKTTEKKRVGKVRYRRDDGNVVPFREYEKKSSNRLNDLQKTAIMTMEKLSAALGVDFYVYESYVKDGKRYYVDESGIEQEGAPNGWYDKTTGDIYIDINAGTGGKGTMLFTVAHELTHFIRQNSPEKFRKLGDYVFKHGGLKSQGAALVEAKMATAEERNKPIDYDTAYEEVVADGMETILSSGRVVEMMAEIKQNDQTLWKTICDWFRDLVKDIRALVDAYKGVTPDTIEGRMVADMNEVVRKIESLYAEALIDAGSNFQTAEKNTTDGGKMFMSRDIGSVTEATVRADLEEIYDGIDVAAYSYIPLAQTTPFAVRYITGYKTDRPIIVEKKKAYFDMRESGKFKEDRSHHYHGMGVDGFVDAMNILEDPDYVIKECVGNEKYHYAFIGLNEDGEEVCIAFEMSVSKSEAQMNGYPGGFYNLDITEFVITDDWLEARGVEPGTLYKDYLLSFDGKEIAYDRQFHFEQLEKARSVDSGSAGVAASHINNRASKNSIRNNEGIVNPESAAALDISADAKTESVAPAVLKSERTDTDGNKLSEDQQAYFADSKVRDAEGKLQVMYRGDSADVNVFDRKKSRPSNLYGRGFYFTSSKSHAGQYGDARAFYLNIKNPLRPNQNSITREQMLKFLQAIEEDGEDYDLYNYGENATANSVLKLVWGKGDFEMLQDVSASAIGDLVAAVELFNSINGTDYDGLILPTETVIFQSEQAKLTSNKTPTSNPNILLSERINEPVSDRELLANAPDNVAEGYWEQKTLAEYKQIVAEIEARESRLREISEQYQNPQSLPIKERIAVQDERIGLQNRNINSSNKLLRLEAQKPLQRVLERLRHLETEREMEEFVRYQDRVEESVSNRNLLANALEGAVQNEAERELLEKYRSQVSEMEGLEKKLEGLSAKLRELSFKPGPRDKKQIEELRGEITETRNRVSAYDAKLLRLEAAAPIKKLVDREKQKAYKRATQKAEAYRKRISENRSRTSIRNKIKAFKERLERSLLSPTDRQYVPVDLIKAMVDVCGLIDTDTEIYKADGSINRAQQKREETKKKLQALRDEYEKLKTPKDPVYEGEFDEMVYTYLSELRDSFSGKSLKEMTLDELSEMYEILKGIEETLQDARKLIGWGEMDDVYEAGDAIIEEQTRIALDRKNGKRNAVQRITLSLLQRTKKE